MHLDLGPRRTGKTTKMLLKVAQAIVQGERVLVVVQNYHMIHSLAQQLNVMLNGVLVNCPTSVVAADTDGMAYFASPDTLERVIKGRAFNAFFSDPGELEEHEQHMIAPHIQTDDTFGVPDVQHFQTEYEGNDFELQPIDEQPAPPVRRVLSSR